MAEKKFHSKVRGVNQKNQDGYERQKYIRSYCKPGTPLILKREPNNPHDANAIGVWVKAKALVFFADTVQIGYIGAEVAEELAPIIDRGGKVEARISEITGGTKGKEALGVNIEVSIKS
jgi:hypothetical protein